METVTFENMFGFYVVPKDVYVDPNVANTTPAPQYALTGMIGTININNALGFQAYQLAVSNWKLNGSQGNPPAAPSYWKFEIAEFAAYWNALTMNGTGFNPAALPHNFGMPDGIGGSFVPQP